MTILKYDDVIKKRHASLITILVFFGRSYVVPHPCKVSELGFNWFKICDGGHFALNPLPLPSRLFNVKKVQAGLG